MKTPILSRLCRAIREPSEIDEPIQPQTPNASVTTAINGLALVSAVMISSGFSWVKTTTTATMTSSMVIIERRGESGQRHRFGGFHRLLVSQRGDTTPQALEQLLVPDSSARVGEGTATF